MQTADENAKAPSDGRKWLLVVVGTVLSILLLLILGAFGDAGPNMLLALGLTAGTPSTFTVLLLLPSWGRLVTAIAEALTEAMRLGLQPLADTYCGYGLTTDVIADPYGHHFVREGETSPILAWLQNLKGQRLIDAVSARSSPQSFRTQEDKTKAQALRSFGSS